MPVPVVSCKLSCIDYGEISGHDTVQDHTQCITEAHHLCQHLLPRNESHNHRHTQTHKQERVASLNVSTEHTNLPRPYPHVRVTGYEPPRSYHHMSSTIHEPTRSWHNISRSKQSIIVN
ncbi:hypothetical protein DEO72_LG4g244 [Vigna unguiculata]|uniref:Uncharacterized protein n=1 Tax=Vigna unguiculata TaxID=3917 RepID=A0A4D6LLA6_VIGUN|nr:hypothetical protein DEO72_LG4g244 [Vigna unguiculata]